MNKLYTIIRIVLGGMMIGSGIMMLVLGGFPTEYGNAVAAQYMNTLVDMKYFVPLLAIVKILCGLSFATKRFMSMGLVIFASISLNMVLFHIFLEPVTGIPAYLIFAMNIYLMVKHLPHYKALLQSKQLA